MKMSMGEKWFYGVNYIILSLAALSRILPIFHIVSLSLSDSEAITLGQVGLWPVQFSLEAYNKLITGTDVLGAFQNSLVITIVGTALNMLFTILTAYPLSRSYFYGRRFFTLAIVFTMLFTAGLIPNYLLIKSLGLLNSYFALWLPALISAYNLLILRTFFESVPVEIEEAARIDGQVGNGALLSKSLCPYLCQSSQPFRSSTVSIIGMLFSMY